MAIYCVLIVAVLQNCSEKVTNPASQANVHGILLTSSGAPAKGAVVRFVKSGSDPRTGLSKRMAAIDSTVTGNNGSYSAQVDTGTYNVLSSGDSGLSYQDSVLVGNGSTTVPQDTLKAPGSIRGVVRLQPGDDARTVFLLFLGTNTLGTPNDAIGNFSIANMADGSYRVRILTTLDLYVPKDTVLSVTAGKADTLPHDIVLQYTGIPIPSGLKFAYDTLKQVVKLTWNIPTTGRTVSGYNVYRKRSDSTSFVCIVSDLKDTVYKDSTGVQEQTYEYRVAAVDSNGTEGVKSSGVSVIVVGPYVLAGSFGSGGSGDGQFIDPEGIAMDKTGNIYVVDAANHRVARFRQDGNFINNIQPQGWNSLPGYAIFSDIAIDSNGTIFIAEYQNQQVVYKIDTGGTVLDTFTGLSQPWKICIDKSQNLYITELSKTKVIKVSSNGVLLDSLLSISGYLTYGSRIAVDDSGNVYIAGDSNIVKCSATGAFIKAFGKIAPVSGIRVRGMAIEKQGNIFVCETQRVQVFDANGNFVLRFQLRDTSIIEPLDIAIADNGDIFITDAGGQYAGGQYRVLKYRHR
jgi:hypothetical protein